MYQPVDCTMKGNPQIIKIPYPSGTLKVETVKRLTGEKNTSCWSRFFNPHEKTITKTRQDDESKIYRLVDWISNLKLHMLKYHTVAKKWFHINIWNRWHCMDSQYQTAIIIWRIIPRWSLFHDISQPCANNAPVPCLRWKHDLSSFFFTSVVGVDSVSCCNLGYAVNSN